MPLTSSASWDMVRIHSFIYVFPRLGATCNKPELTVTSSLAGLYAGLAAICFHFFFKYRRKSNAHRIIVAYTVIMFVINTIYFGAAAKWSEIEFVESTVDPGVFATLESSHIAILKNVAYVFNFWLSDSLIVCSTISSSSSPRSALTKASGTTDL